MKREAIHAALIGAVGAFLLSFGAMSCVVTAFSLEIGLFGLALSCALYAAVFAVCFSLRRGAIPVACVGALALVLLWRGGSLMSGFSDLAYTVSDYYRCAYGWSVIGRPGEGVTTAVKLLGALIALCTAWTICRRKSAMGAFLATFLPLVSCFVVTDTVPEEFCLFLLFVGLIELMLTNSLRRTDAAQANRLCAVTVLPVAAALAMLFLFVPQEGYVNHAEDYGQTVLTWLESLPQMVEEASGDLIAGIENTVRSESVDLRAQGPRTLYAVPVMDILSSQSGTVYLREQDYDTYDGTGWSSTANRAEKFSRSDSLEWSSAGVVTVTTRVSRDVLFVPYYPQESMTFRGGHAQNEEDTALYTYTLYALPSNWRTLAQGQDGRSDTRYLSLPARTRDWAQTLVDTIVDDGDSATQKADAIARYVRNSAVYSLDTEKMPLSESEFTRWFLEKSDTGYCVHFATAAAVLLRAAGVSSRYVTGYMVSAVHDQQVTVTTDEAHAWVEYYEPTLGIWIPLEATPAAADAPADTPQETSPTDPVDTEPAPDSEETHFTQTPSATTADVPNVSDGTDEAPLDAKSLLSTLAALCAFAVAVFASVYQRTLRIAVRRRRILRSDPNARALLMWREVVRYSRIFGEVPPRALEQLAEKAKYSSHTLERAETARFEQYLSSARARCRTHRWYRRFVYRWIFALY